MQCNCRKSTCCCCGLYAQTPLMILFTAISSFGQEIWQGDMGAVGNWLPSHPTLQKPKKNWWNHVFLYSSLEPNLAVRNQYCADKGWLQHAVDSMEKLPQSRISVWVCCISCVSVASCNPYLLVITFVMTKKMNVEKANKELRAKDWMVRSRKMRNIYLFFCRWGDD